MKSAIWRSKKIVILQGKISKYGYSNLKNIFNFIWKNESWFLPDLHSTGNINKASKYVLLKNKHKWSLIYC
jgi:hypothetical protein